MYLSQKASPSSAPPPCRSLPPAPPACVRVWAAAPSPPPLRGWLASALLPPYEGDYCVVIIKEAS